MLYENHYKRFCYDWGIKTLYESNDTFIRDLAFSPLTKRGMGAISGLAGLVMSVSAQVQEPNEQFLALCGTEPIVA